MKAQVSSSLLLLIVRSQMAAAPRIFLLLLLLLPCCCTWAFLPPACPLKPTPIVSSSRRAAVPFTTPSPARVAAMRLASTVGGGVEAEAAGAAAR
jgi:hypothetical protein